MGCGYVYIYTPNWGSKRLVEPPEMRRWYHDWPTNSRDLSCDKTSGQNWRAKNPRSCLKSVSIKIIWYTLRCPKYGYPKTIDFPIDNKQVWLNLGYPYVGQTHVCLCIYIYMHIYFYLYIHIHMYICIYVYVILCICVYMYMCIYIYISTYLYIDIIHAHLYTHTRRFKDFCIRGRRKAMPAWNPFFSRNLNNQRSTLWMYFMDLILQ